MYTRCRNWIVRAWMAVLFSPRFTCRLLLDERGAVGDIKMVYAAASTLTQTNLDGIASSATWVAGWGSATIDNSSSLHQDYAIGASIMVESGEIRMYLVAELNDSAYPDCLSAGTEGTEGTVTFTDTEIRDAVARLAARTATDTTASRVYTLQCPSVKKVFGGTCPRKFFIVITQSTGAALESTGDPNQVYVKGVYYTVAQS